MNALKILETKRTPAINFDPVKGRLELTGYRSMPEESHRFYKPVIDWVNDYIRRVPASSTVILFKLEYFNTSSGKHFVEILKKLDQLASKGHPVYMKWYYEEDDEDMAQSGDDMEATVKYIDVEKIPYTNA